MNWPFSIEEIKKTLEKDAGFKNKLASMSENEENFLKGILLDNTLLEKLAELLPDSLKEESLSFLNRAVDYPNRAIELYKECRFLEARKLLEETVRIYSSVPYTGCATLDEATRFVSTRLNALCYDLLGDIEWNLGNTARASKYHEKSLQLATETGDRGTIAKALMGLGIHHWDLGDHEKALEFTHEALTHLDGTEDYWGIKDKVCTILSICYDELGNSDEALKYALSAVEIALNLADRKHLPEILNNLACLYVATGELSSAVDILEQALSVAEEEKVPREQVVILNNLALCCLMGANDVDLALDFLHAAYEVLEKLESPYLEAFTLLSCALIYRAMGETNLATEVFPTPGGPIRQMIGPLSDRLSLHTERNSRMRSLGSLSP